MNKQNDKGMTLLMFASLIPDNQDALQYLIDGKANVDLQNKKGLTALMYACQKGFVGNAKALIDGKANLEVQCKRNRTALVHCIETNEDSTFKLMKMLHRAGANIHYRCDQKETLIHLYYDHPDSCLFLFDQGSDPFQEFNFLPSIRVRKTILHHQMKFLFKTIPQIPKDIIACKILPLIENWPQKPTFFR